MQDIEKTRAGLTPAMASEVPYSITTQVAEDYLQRLLDTVVEKGRQKGKNLPEVTVSLSTLECSNKFRPFVLILPASVLLNNSDSKKNRDEAAIFSTSGDGDNRTRITDYVYNVIKAFFYSKDDAEAFTKSGDMKRRLRLTSSVGYHLKSMVKPRTRKTNHGKDKCVIVALDPIKLFHHMLENPQDSNRNFLVDIGKTDKIRDGNFKYEVFKVYTGKGKNKNRKRTDSERVASEIQRDMLRNVGGNRR